MSKRQPLGEASMSGKITADHLARVAVVYVRQSTMAQVVGNLESQRRQYGLAGTAKVAGFASVTVMSTGIEVSAEVGA
jgi:hypothetical protein